MKPQSYQKCFNVMLLTLAFYVIVSISACEDSPAKEVATVKLDSFEAKDRGNEGNASDILLVGQFSGSLDKYAKIRFILASSPVLNITKASSLGPDSYAEIDLAGYFETYLTAGLKDSDGEFVSEGKSYTTFILVLPAAGAGDPLLLQASIALTLADEIVVTTPKLKGVLTADEDISIDIVNNLYISGGKINPTALFKISADGTITTLGTGLNHPVGNTLDHNGNVYVTNFQSININRVTPTGATSVFITDPKLTGGGGIIVDNNGMIYNTFYSSKTIFKISASGVVDFATSDKLNGPVGMAYDHVNDRIFVSNLTDGKIFMVQKDGTISEIADTPATIGHLDYREDVLYITGFNENKVYLVSTNGQILKTIGSGNKATKDGVSFEASFFNPNGIAVSKDGKFIYVSGMDGTLRKIVL
jgi:sugar lactone lactonase YvrE